jgi:hypothetical protein
MTKINHIMFEAWASKLFMIEGCSIDMPNVESLLVVQNNFFWVIGMIKALPSTIIIRLQALSFKEFG